MNKSDHDRIRGGKFGLGGTMSPARALTVNLRKANLFFAMQVDLTQVNVEALLTFFVRRHIQQTTSSLQDNQGQVKTVCVYFDDWLHPRLTAFHPAYGINPRHRRRHRRRRLFRTSLSHPSPFPSLTPPGPRRRRRLSPLPQP